MKFTKMHGCGNDYVYVNCFEENVEHPAELAVRVSDRHFGIGSDGLILIKPSKQADCFMEMYNADGSLSAMCGNGIRCVAKYLYDHKMVSSEVVTIDTYVGLKTIRLQVSDNSMVNATVDMGSPVIRAKDIPVLSEEETVIDKPITVGGQEYRVTCVSMGNPHAVVFVDEVKNLAMESIGPLFEHHERFPERTNTEFIEVLNKNEINMRVWERGSGETLACGTGACAAVYACILNKKTESEVLVHLPGGDLLITYDKLKNTVYMTGPATTSYTGDFVL